MRIGIPAEVKNHEYRVAITPAGVHELALNGHEVFVQAEAGPGLDEGLVPVEHEFPDPGWGDGHPVLVVLDLRRDADLHGSSKSRLPRVCLHDSVTVRNSRTIFGMKRETGDIISPCLG